jgi:hypothetical protein
MFLLWGFLYLITFLIYQTESGKSGFFTYSTDIKKALNDFGDCSNSFATPTFIGYDLEGKGFFSNKNNDPGLKKILIIGGVHGSVTAAAEVVYFLKYFCEGINNVADWDDLFDNFSFDFIPVVYPSLYDLSYGNMTESGKDKIITNETNCADPDENINESFCTDQKSLDFLDNSDEYTFIINIQGTKSSYDSNSKLKNDKQKYVYETVLNTRPKIKQNSLVDKVLNFNETYIFQYKHDLKSKIDSEAKNDFEDDFNDIFLSLSQAFPSPNITFYNATENKDPSEKNPSNVTIMLAAWNSFPFPINMQIQIDIQINKDDVSRVLEYIELQTASFSLYDDNEDVEYESFGEIPNSAQNVSGDENKIWAYNLTIDNLELSELSYRGLKFIFSRKIGGQIKFDINAEAVSVAGSNFFRVSKNLEENGQYVWLVPDSDNHDYAPKSLVLFLMMLIFLVIILVIACTVLVRSKPKRLLG